MFSLFYSGKAKPFVLNLRLNAFFCFSSVQSLSLVQLFCDPMDCSMPGFPVHHQLPELTQTHVHQVSDAIQPSHPLLSPSPPAFSLSQHQGLFQWVSSSHQVAKVLEFQFQHQSFQWIFKTDFLYDLLVWSPCSPGHSQEPSPTPQFKSINSLAFSFLYSPTLTSTCDYWKNSFDYTDWEGNRHEGQGSPNGGNRLQVSDIFISLKRQEETN